MAHAPYQPLSPVEEAMRRLTEATLVTPEHGKWWGKCCKREHASKIILVVFVVGLFSYIAVDTFTTQYILGWMLDLNRFIQNSGDKGVLYLATMLFFLTILGIPATIFIVGGGFAFSERYPTYGIVVNILACWVGTTAGGCVAFLLGRYYLRKTVKGYIRKNKMRIVRAVDIAMKKEGTKMAILLRLVPYIPWNVFNYVAGVTGMRFYSFVVGSIGGLPWTTVCTFIGSGLSDLDEAANGTSGGGGKERNIILVAGLVSTVVTTVAVNFYAKKALAEIELEERQSRFSESSIIVDSRSVSKADGGVDEVGGAAAILNDLGGFGEGIDTRPLIESV
ncbi:hypothetical protein TrCOL_g283 [Triparma columacea]|uniref:VTT domain-containing protein n=1 Tax=Triparma columacea TaxID=722753 RepID=A0A9W7LD76_9STRA|nr:hypothetical protein TrCOL_g283 [Triparma columacea]